MTDFAQFIPAHIRKLAESAENKPLKQDASGTSPIALNLNENPYGPSPLAIKALSSALQDVHRYPEIQATDLHEAIAAFHGIAPQQVLVTAGATELLCIIARALLAPGLSAVTSAKSFIVYKLAAQVTEGRLIEVSTLDDGYDLEAISRTVDSNTRIIFVANPNNPTGTFITAEKMDAFVDGLPEHILLVLDEAYGDYAGYFAKKNGVVYSRALNYIAQGRNVILLKTFSKAHGLAGLRVGYGIGPARLISLFTPLRTIFSISSVAQAAACAALRDSSHVQAAVDNNAKQAAFLQSELKNLGLPVPRTWANFLYCELGSDAAVFATRLRERGIIVQPLGLWGAPTAIRVSVGTPEQNAAFLAAMKRILA